MSDDMGSLFSYARKEGFPTMHEENKTPVTVDVLETGWVLCFVILGFTFLLIVPGVHGKTKLFLFIRLALSLFIGASIMIGNFGQEWEVGHIYPVITPYKAGDPQEIKSSVGIKLGLRSVNITLKSTDHHENENNSLRNEIINYNERFTWTWDQGRFGFGPYAGRLQQEFREAQIKGLPIPILWVADYFTWDGEGLRFGRHYRTAGWYSHIAMWAALPCWMLANFMYTYIIRYGAYHTLICGALQILACILWRVIRNPIPLRIPLGDKEITTTFGFNFWLTLSSGILCIVIGIVVLALDLRFPNELATFFGTDPLADYEEYHLTSDELNVLRHGGKHSKEINMVVLNGESAIDDPEEVHTQMVLKRHATVNKAQKSLFRAPQFEDELPLYVNMAINK